MFCDTLQHLVDLLLNHGILLRRLVGAHPYGVGGGKDARAGVLKEFSNGIEVEFLSLLNNSGNLLCGFRFHVWVLVFWVCGLLA